MSGTRALVTCWFMIWRQLMLQAPTFFTRESTQFSTGNTYPFIDYVVSSQEMRPFFLFHFENRSQNCIGYILLFLWFINCWALFLKNSPTSIDVKIFIIIINIILYIFLKKDRQQINSNYIINMINSQLVIFHWWAYRLINFSLVMY